MFATLMAVVLAFMTAEGATNVPALFQPLAQPGLGAASRQATEADHLRMMNLLKIKPSGVAGMVLIPIHRFTPIMTKARPIHFLICPTRSC